MRQNNSSSKFLLEMNTAFKAAGVEFLNAQKSLVLEYLNKTNAEDKANSTLRRFKNVGFKFKQ